MIVSVFSFFVIYGILPKDIRYQKILIFRIKFIKFITFNKEVMFIIIMLKVYLYKIIELVFAIK